MTDRGKLLEIEGKSEGGVMILTGEDHARHTLVRGWWKPENGEVRETAATSTDDGKTWKPWFDLIFRPEGMLEEHSALVRGRRQKDYCGARHPESSSRQRMMQPQWTAFSPTILFW